MLNWYNFVFIFFSIANFTIFILLLLKPRLLQPVLVAVIITTSAIELYQRQFGGIYAVFVILLAIFFLILNGKLKIFKQKQKYPNTLHQMSFLLMSIYFMLQALRGFLFYTSIGITYWVIVGWFVFFAVIGILSSFLSHNNLPKIDRNKLIGIIAISVVAFMSCYILAGFYVEKYVRQFVPHVLMRDLQHILTSDTTQVSFLFIIGLTSAILLLKKANIKFSDKILATSLFALAFVYGYFWTSRFTILIILFFITIGLATIWSRKILWFLLIPALVATLNFQHITYIPQRVATDVITTLQGRDGRSGLTIRALEIVKKDPIAALFGFGINSYKHKLNTTFAPGLVVTIIDAGLIGLILIFLNFILTGKRILLQKNNYGKTVLLTALALTGSFLLISQSLTNTLFYYMIMPGGLLIQLCTQPQQKTK